MGYDVTDLTERRNARLYEGDVPKVCSVCGSHWWTVKAVTFRIIDDSVSGWAGPVACHDCGSIHD